MNVFFTSAFYLFSVCVLFAQKTDTLFYSVVKTGIIAGEQKIWRTGINQHHFLYYYNDRGRGDSLQAAVRTNADGLIISLKATGVDFRKYPYTESLNVIGDSATSSINGMRTTHAFNNTWYHTPIIPGITQMRLNWLLQQPNKKGSTISGSSIHTEEPVEKNITFNGKSATLKLYAVYSDSVALPQYVWFTKDTDFFASLGLFSIIHKGYETWIDTLLALQEQAGQKYYIQQISQQSVNMPGRLRIEHATVFQSATATVKKDMTLEIMQGRITAIYPSAEKKKANADSVIDAKGKFLMPGLWDMHLHYEAEKSEGDWFLAGGVTHGRDIGHANILLSYKSRIAANQLIGPDISYIGGLIDKRGLYQSPGGTIVSSLNEAIEAIYTYKRLGYQQIKLYSSIDPKWVKPMCAEAHKLGMRIGGHVPAFMTAEQAVNSGYDEVNHLPYLFFNFLGDTLDTRINRRYPAFGSLSSIASTLDLESNQVKSFIQLLKEKKIIIDATLNHYAETYTEFQGDTSSKLKPIMNWMPDYMRKDLALKIPYRADSIKEVYRSAFKNMLKMMKLLYDQGIQLVAGTDGGRAIALHRELELYVEAGIPANEVLKIATYNAAKTCGFLGKYGEIKPGCMADFILIDGNPAQNIGDIRRVKWVIKNNKLYNPKQLLAVRGWSYYY